MKQVAAALVLSLALTSHGPPGTSDPGAPAKQLMSRYAEAYEQDLRTITNIDSGTGDAEGSRAMAEFVKGHLEPLGAQVEFRESDRATHVIARFKGEGRLKLLLIAQTDTVFARGVAAQRPFHIDSQRRGYGAGVGDGKAAVLQAIYAMKLLKDLNIRKYGEIVLYFDGEEETGSAFSNTLLQELAPQADAVLVLETGRPDWGIVTRRKGRALYEIKVTGRSGHAGNAAQSSASAVMELGYLLTRLHHLASPLPREPLAYTRESLEKQGIQDHGQFVPPNTINVGVIETPNRSLNVIPDQAVARLEVRCFDSSEQERLDRAIRDLAKDTTVGGTTVTVKGGITKRPM
ncbi:MAG TPA: M20/M25/M40 family metallo-hydrolase, partial [Stenomitos sp.]